MAEQLTLPELNGEATATAIVKPYETDERGFPLTDQFGRELDPLFYTKVNAELARQWRMRSNGHAIGAALPIAEVSNGDGQL